MNVRDIGNPLGLYRVSQDWQADEVTWNEYRTNQPWQQPGAKGVEDAGTLVAEMEGRDFGAFVWVLAGKQQIRFNEAGMTMISDWISDPSSKLWHAHRQSTAKR